MSCSYSCCPAWRCNLQPPTAQQLPLTCRQRQVLCCCSRPRQQVGAQLTEQRQQRQAACGGAQKQGFLTMQGLRCPCSALGAHQYYTQPCCQAPLLQDFGNYTAWCALQGPHCMHIQGCQAVHTEHCCEYPAPSHLPAPAAVPALFPPAASPATAAAARGPSQGARSAPGQHPALTEAA
jgi:hypothetical protein